MSAQQSWGWFKNDPINICENAVVSDACQRGATIKVVSNDGRKALVEYKGERDFVPSADLLERPAPEYEWNDKVFVISKGIDACVVDVCWHFNEQRYYYYLEDAQGKELKKRYFGDELARV